MAPFLALPKKPTTTAAAAMSSTATNSLPAADHSGGLSCSAPEAIARGVASSPATPPSPAQTPSRAAGLTTPETPASSPPSPSVGQKGKKRAAPDGKGDSRPAKKNKKAPEPEPLTEDELRARNVTSMSSIGKNLGKYSWMSNSEAVKQAQHNPHKRPAETDPEIVDTTPPRKKSKRSKRKPLPRPEFVPTVTKMSPEELAKASRDYTAEHDAYEKAGMPCPYMVQREAKKNKKMLAARDRRKAQAEMREAQEKDTHTYLAVKKVLADNAAKERAERAREAQQTASEEISEEADEDEVTAQPTAALTESDESETQGGDVSAEVNEADLTPQPAAATTETRDSETQISDVCEQADEDYFDGLIWAACREAGESEEQAVHQPAAEAQPSQEESAEDWEVEEDEDEEIDDRFEDYSDETAGLLVLENPETLTEKELKSCGYYGRA